MSIFKKGHHLVPSWLKDILLYVIAWFCVSVHYNITSTSLEMER